MCLQLCHGSHCFRQSSIALVTKAILTTHITHRGASQSDAPSTWQAAAAVALQACVPCCCSINEDGVARLEPHGDTAGAPVADWPTHPTGLCRFALRLQSCHSISCFGTCLAMAYHAMPTVCHVAMSYIQSVVFDGLWTQWSLAQDGTGLFVLRVHVSLLFLHDLCF